MSTSSPGPQVREESGGVLKPVILGIQPQKKGCRKPGRPHDCEIARHRQNGLPDLRQTLHDKIEDDNGNERQGGFHGRNRQLELKQELVPGHRGAPTHRTIVAAERPRVCAGRLRRERPDYAARRTACPHEVRRGSVNSSMEIASIQRHPNGTLNDPGILKMNTA